MFRLEAGEVGGGLIKDEGGLVLLRATGNAIRKENMEAGIR